MSEVCGNPECGKECVKPRVCERCKATPYCSRKCQKLHWKVHKKICSTLNAGRAQQLNHPDHEKKNVIIDLNVYVSKLIDFPHNCQEMYRLFKATTENEKPKLLNNRVEQMKKLAMELSEDDQLSFMHLMCCILLLTKPWQVKLETSPLLVLLQVGGDPNTIPKKGCYTCLGLVAAQHSMKTSFNENQVTISKQLIEVGCADVNLACSKEQVGAIPPLYFACWSTHCTNLDFIQLLLEHGANPNQQMVDLRTPLMNTLAMSLSAALFILKFEHDNAVNVDVHIRDRYGESVLDMVKVILTQFVRQRDTVFRTGKADPISDTGWTTTAPYDTHIEQLIELTYLLEARGAKMSPKPGVPISMKKLCGITTWSGHLALTCNWQQNQCTNIDSINFDISSLFNMDIMTDSNAPSWCKDKNGKCIFFISDKKTIQFQNHEGKDHLHSAGGCTPAVGQKLQIQCNLPGNLQGCRLAGKVVEVFPAPSDTDLKRSKRSSNPSFLYQNPCHCSDPKCSQTKTGKRFDILRKFGCLHGQEVKGTVSACKGVKKLRDD